MPYSYSVLRCRRPFSPPPNPNPPKEGRSAFRYMPTQLCDFPLTPLSTRCVSKASIFFAPASGSPPPQISLIWVGTARWRSALRAWCSSPCCHHAPSGPPDSLSLIRPTGRRSRVHLDISSARGSQLQSSAKTSAAPQGLHRMCDDDALILIHDPSSFMPRGPALSSSSFAPGSARLRNADFTMQISGRHYHVLWPSHT